MSYDANTVGKLNLTNDKFFVSFEKEIKETFEETRKSEILTQLTGEAEKTIENVFTHLPRRKIKLSLEIEHLHRLHNRDKVLQKRGTKPRIDSKTASLIRDYSLKNNTKTQQEIADYIFKEFNVPISQPSICVLFKKLGITRKRLTFHYNQLDKEKAKEFNKEIKTLLDKTNFIAIDECSFYPNLDPRFGYSLKGERAVSRRPSSQEEINPIGDKRNILMMDNARIHIASRKRKEAGFLSVEEQMLKKNTKTEKQRPRNYEEMKSAIEEVVKLLNSKDLSKYFWHCAEYFDEKDAKIDLLETIKKL
ncbi:20227_t:CDS:2 [Gigaspora margarita]|uniref:20227_t:CDS:1 n=1 Tax=Gigaspora margarita TaxID=4874 RepID=A0ABN7W8V5_GIGMA|nr:20227_t:CDS:2 [Gigaspora margarita]